jgi:hypothetical protein
LSFNLDGGYFNIFRSNGELLINGGTISVNSGFNKYLSSSGSFVHNSEIIDISKNGNTARTLKILSINTLLGIELETSFTLDDEYQAISIEVICKNGSNNDLQIDCIEPLRILTSDGGLLQFPDATKCLTNGALYYDTGKLHTFGTPFIKPKPYGETKGGKLTNHSISTNNETVTSWWNIGFFSGYNKEGLVIGYLENRKSLGQIIVSKTSNNNFSIVAESVFAPGTIIKAGNSLTSDPLLLSIADNPYQTLESYASAVGKANSARTNNIINGWCNWFYTYEHITEIEIIRNAEFASQHLKQFGFGYIQVDEGFQKYHGDWEGNERFPHGMKWLADKINSLGLKAGIWISPFLISEPTEVFQKHPDWLLKNPDGSLKRVGPWPEEDSDWARNENPKRYCLDVTHPEAAEWLFKLMDTIANNWGYDLIKIDFVAWSILSAHHFYDSEITPAQAYRRGYEIIRKAIGENKHIIECGAGAISGGFIDSMRIELDQNYGYFKDVWKQYFLDSSSSSAAAAKRYYFHKRTWINDADHICINLLSNQQAQAAATIIALSGGNAISGDRLTDLDPVKLEILKKVLPSFGEAARPVDLFDSDLPSVFALKINKSFGEWTLIAFFNSSLTESAEKEFPMERFWLDADKTYLAYNFWEEKFIGSVKQSLLVTIPPGSVTLLSLHEKSGTPQFISTSRHITQGGIELENITWDTKSNTISGISSGPLKSSHSVLVYLPEPHPWSQGGHILYKDYDSFNLKMVDDNIIKINLHFDKSEQIEWKINIYEYFK